MDETYLSELLSDSTVLSTSGEDVTVGGVSYRSDATQPGDVFFCVPGLRADGHSFAADAATHGAVALVVERPLDVDLPQAVVADSRAALAWAAARWNGFPTRRLDVFGVTGTNGKTTTTYLMDAVLRAAGRRTGIIGTVETRIAGQRLRSSRTTPESADLQALFAQMLAEGVSAASIEVSSHAIDLHRVDALRFAVAAFTNLTQDHLDYHHTIEAYFAVKRRLFTDLDVGERVIDIDGPYGLRLAEDLGGSCLTVGRSSEATVRAVDERRSANGTRFTLITPAGERELLLPIAGAFNVSNALAAAGGGLAMGIALDTVVEGLRHAPQVPGRLERVDEGQGFAVLVDYSHTPDSLEKAIAAARGVTAGRVIVVFGCGGDRDPAKRPIMGAVAGAGADVSIVTSDNPRSEDPLAIIGQIEGGLRRSGGSYLVEPDRAAAIGMAIGEARSGDIVLIAGKGHEDYQIFADRTIHFDDRETAREKLRSRC